LDVLSKKQLMEIAKIIEDHTGVLLKITTGEGNASSSLLNKLGIPLEAPSMIDNAFVLGKILQVMEENDVKNMTYDDLKKKAREYSLSQVERNSLNYAKVNAAKYVTGLGQRINTKVTSNINHASAMANLKVAERNLIRDKVAQGILKQQTRGELVSELGHSMEEWKRDWQRLAHTELWNAKLQGEVVAILQGDSIYSNTKRGDTQVFRRPSPTACNHCNRLYLQSDGVTPKVFTLSELINNGTNVGKKVSDWKPITGTTHPNCSCPIAVLPEGFGFDKNGNLEYQGVN
jgi:hypothetical protein